MENVYSSLQKVISCIMESSAYQKCLLYREKMDHNEDVQSIVNAIKDTQKKYVKSHYDSEIKDELDTLQSQLFQIPIYSMYQDSLDEVNRMIDTVRESMNDYFFQLLNSKEKN